MRQFRFHLPALVIVVGAMLLGQWATFSQKPLIYFAGDSLSYLDAASAMATKAQWLQSLRTPGYPALLALLFTLGGWTNYALVITVQMLLMSLTLLEGYLLLWRLTHQRWVACMTMAMLGVNLYVLNWERSLLSETLAFWSLVTLLLCFEKAMRTLRLWIVLTFAAISFIAIMIHPFMVFVPALLLVLLCIYRLRRHGLRRQGYKIVIAFVLIYGCLFGYMVALSVSTVFFGLTWVTNINAFGKVLEYHLQDASSDPHYATLHRKVSSYIRQGGWEPWTFINAQEPDTYATQGRMLGAYSLEIIVHHPVRYAIKTMPDIMAVWLAQPEFYAPYGNAPVGNFGPYTPFPNTPMGTTATGGGPLGITSPSYEPFWITLLLAISTMEQQSYWLLPVVILYWGQRTWKHPQERNSFLYLTMAVLILCSISMVAAGSYDEFYRLRFPVDGLMIMLSVITGIALWKSAFCHTTKRSESAQ